MRAFIAFAFIVSGVAISFNLPAGDDQIRAAILVVGGALLLATDKIITLLEELLEHNRRDNFVSEIDLKE